MLSVELAFIKVYTGKGMIVCIIIFVCEEMRKIVPELDHLDESANSIYYPFDPSQCYHVVVELPATLSCDLICR
jgi:hypothetical protein